MTQLTPTLSLEHRTALKKSAIADDVIESRRYRTITQIDDLTSLGFSVSQIKVPGLLLPVHTTDGGNGLYSYRPDNPRVLEDKSKRNPDGTHPNKVLKYEMPKEAGVRLDCPPLCRPSLENPSVPLWITEGQKKADALASIGCCAIALLGVWNFVGKNEFGGTTFLADWGYIALKNREVRIVFDSDVMTKIPVKQALARLSEHLQRKGATVEVVYLPPSPNGKVGVDDWLAEGHTRDELETLITAPKPEIKAAAPSVELLDDAPETINRPLRLLGGRGYAATWLPVRETIKETIDKKGEVIRLRTPLVKNSIRLFIVRDDGVVFGEGGDKSLEELGLEVHLPGSPEASLTWSSRGVKDFGAGMRANPVDVFGRMVDIVDQFIDFNRSFGSQHEMCELVACYALSTWFLDAFNVVGNLWSNGDRGCGKTQLLIICAAMGYLGQVILSSGSFATLRDLADYGAMLCFDDAEAVAEANKQNDQDKRALLLAGNRRGATVPLKELAPDKTWRTRYVNAFCPRLFSAIRIPDPVLASRTIIIPLIRTPDPVRANADPIDITTWRHDRRQLVDDLWALSVANLKDLPAYDKQLSVSAPLAGRALQPWRSILAVAKWLEDRGAAGLRERMDNLALEYQRERPELESVDLTYLVIRAVVNLVRRDHNCDISDMSDGGDINKEIHLFRLGTTKITDTVIAIAKAEEMDIDVDHITPRRVGRTLGKMRIKATREGGKGNRQWNFSADQLRSLALSYGVIDKLKDTTPINVTTVTNVTNVTQTQEQQAVEWVETPEEPPFDEFNYGEAANMGYTEEFPEPEDE